MTFVILVVFPLSIVLVRVWATTVTAFRAPIRTLFAFPRNWSRLALATDTRELPELLPTPIRRTPGSLINPENFRLNRIAAFCWREMNEARGVYRAMTLVFVPLFFCLMASPVVLYRWSLKSTAIVWFPVLWALRAIARNDKRPLVVRLALLKDSDVFRLVLGVSVLAIVLFAVRLYVTQASGDFAKWWNTNVARATSMPAASAPGGVATTSAAPASGPIARVVRATTQATAQAEARVKGFVRSVLTIYMDPDEIPIWQVAMVVNSILAICAWLWIRSCLRHIKEGVPRPERLVEGVLGWTLFVRRLLSTYTIACMLYLYVREASTWDLPPLGSKWFPWQ